jgi:tetratricopeptide (TPR) repeat protein
MFLKAIECGGDVAPKGMLNLGLLYHGMANKLAQGTTAPHYIYRLHQALVRLTACCPIAGHVKEAKSLALKASDLADAAKPILEEMAGSALGGPEIASYINQLKPLRLQCHRMVGQLLASEGDLAGCEKEFRAATDSFPTDPGAWQMLARVLEIQGKADEAKAVFEKVKALTVANGWK